ncbi:6197_t:CDS:1, partial [Gigaspora margarita]
MDRSEDNLVFDYKALGKDLENVNKENIGELNVNNISGKEYEEVE